MAQSSTPPRRKSDIRPARAVPRVQPDAAPPPVSPSRLDCAAGALLALAVAVLYGMTMARDLILGDTPELMTAASVLGVAHPPGYPVFTLLGHLFSLLPFGIVPFRLNLLSVTCGIGTVFLVYLTALRLTRSRLAAACAGLVLATTPLFWSWSLVYEVFALNNLLAAAIVYLLLLWHDWPERGGFLTAAAALSGIALAHQQTIVLIGPAVLFVLWRRRQALLSRPRFVLQNVAALLLGLLPYLYLPWAAARQPLWNWGDPVTASSFFDVVLRAHYGSTQLSSEASYRGGSSVDRILALLSSFGIVTGILLALGAVQAWRRRRWYFWFGTLAFAVAGPAFVAYAGLDVSQPLLRSILERFFLLSHVLVAPLIAFGVLWIAEHASRFLPAIRAHAEPAAAALVLLAVLAVVGTHYRAVDQSANHVARHFAEDILDTLKPDTVLIANGDEVIMPLAFLVYVEHQRPDVSLLVKPLMHSEWYIRQARRQNRNLNIPFEKYDFRTGTLAGLFDANPRRPFAVSGVEEDASMRDRYWFYRRGLVADVAPVGGSFRLEDMIADTEALYRRYHQTTIAQVKPISMEITVPDQYATPAVFVARQLKQFGLNPAARTWYERALAFNPGLEKVRAELAQVPQP